MINPMIGDVIHEDDFAVDSAAEVNDSANTNTFTTPGGHVRGEARHPTMSVVLRSWMEDKSRNGDYFADVKIIAMQRRQEICM
jgi:hypothetical protein